LGIIVPFCDYLATHDRGTRTLLVVLEGLKVILDDAKEKGSLDQVKTVIDTCGGVGKVELLHEKLNTETIKSAALQVLEYWKTI